MFDPPKKVGRYTPCLNNSCYFTDIDSDYCEVHHIFFGTANRKLSEKWGMKVYLTPLYHRVGKQAAHNNKNTDIELKRFAQRKFEERYSHELFMTVFGKNWL